MAEFSSGARRAVLAFACSCAAAAVAVACAMAGASPEGAPGLSVDRVDPAPGVPARGYEPAVVSLWVAGEARCAGALVASDVVVTARHCVSILPGAVACADAGSVSAEDQSPQTIGVRSGDDTSSATERARARAILVASGADLCGGDVALLLLDASVDGVAPFALRATGAAVADHVRTVGWVDGALVLRDHVLVLATAERQVQLREAAARFGAGGPALDEATGALVGVGSRVAGAGERDTTVYTRADAFASLFEEAMNESAFGSPGPRARVLKAHVGPADLGAACDHGVDCAAGACVALGGARYCSRTCGPRDRCPATFRCEVAASGGAFCIKT